METFLKTFFPLIPFTQIDSVFGFVEPSTLYSGRPYLRRQISDDDYAFMRANNIGLRVPVSNHFTDEEELEKNRPLFEKYHEKGNSLIVTNDYLATWVKKNYPEYQVEASMLKEIETQKDVEKTLEIYDTVVLPMNLNNNIDFLKEIKDKNRVTLFGNAGCALTCPNRICYKRVSKYNKSLAAEKKISHFFYFFFYFGIRQDWCMNKLKPRKLHGIHDFDLNLFYDLGFRRFKLLRQNVKRQTGY